METGTVTVHEKRYMNQPDSLVTVSFQLSGPEWNQLKNTDEWHRIKEMLEEI